MREHTAHVYKSHIPWASLSLIPSVGLTISPTRLDGSGILPKGPNRTGALKHLGTLRLIAGRHNFLNLSRNFLRAASKVAFRAFNAGAAQQSDMREALRTAAPVWHGHPF